jgi:hypothetical protein
MGKNRETRRIFQSRFFFFEAWSARNLFLVSRFQATSVRER